MRWIRKPRFLWIYPLAVWVLFAAHTTERALRIGILLVAAGEALRLWANGYVGHVKVNETAPGQPRIGRLITAGPYAFVQHPLYLGTLLIGAGFCVVIGSWWVGGAALLLFLLTYRAKMAEEEATIQRMWGQEYAAYRAAVPRLVPGFRRYRARHGTWSWQGIAASKEWKTCIWAAVLILLLYLREEIFQESEFLTAHQRVHVMALLLVGVLIASDIGIELARRRAARAS